MNLQTPVSELIGVGEYYSKKIARLDIKTVEDLLLHLPRRWDDYSHIVPISKVRPDETISVRGAVWEIGNKRTRGGLILTEAIIADDSGTLKAVWFNQPFLTKNLKAGDEICLAGKVEWNRGTVAMMSPSYEKINDFTDGTNDERSMTSDSYTHVGRIVPVYTETEGVSSKWLRSRIKPLMKLIYSIRDYLPEEIKREQNLIDLPAAIRQMHFPENLTQLKKAQGRLDFDEMFLLQLAVLNSRKIKPVITAPVISS